MSCYTGTIKINNDVYHIYQFNKNDFKKYAISFTNDFIKFIDNDNVVYETEQINKRNYGICRNYRDKIIIDDNNYKNLFTKDDINISRFDIVKLSMRDSTMYFNACDTGIYDDNIILKIEFNFELKKTNEKINIDKYYFGKNYFQKKLKEIINDYDNYSKNEIIEMLEHIHNKLNIIEY